MTKVELQPLGDTKPQNDNLKFVLDKVKEGVADFVKAIRDSTEEHRGVSFKAFTFRQNLQEDMSGVDTDMENVFAVMMTQVAIELNAHARDLCDLYTFYNSKETEDSEGHRDYSLWLHLQKKAPPTAEEIALKVKELDEAELASGKLIEAGEEASGSKSVE